MDDQWLHVLRAECARTTQSDVARRLGVSAAMVNQALKGTYKGNLGRLQERVRGLLLGVTVDCPVLGDLGRDKCLAHQTRQFLASNPLRVALYRACRTCKHNQQLEGGSHGGKHR
ncbi:MAG: helix-turn-helix transcriptional regulator [Nitrospirota bacterium]|nr:helix-turn-helix transcriptional regulator [Nitrospirota bacterium]